jgi:photosystem II stability/assembly factor-like uncharacterized protein
VKQKKYFLIVLAVFASLALAPAAMSAEKAETDEAHPMAGIALRNIGAAIISGRISDFAFHPQNRNIFYVATASSGVWKTINRGTTWTPIFDNEGAFATGWIELNPDNPDEVWVGTGENNSQRSVAYGDGVYKSIDAGKSWKNVGLKDSGHISQIAFDPRDSKIVYVAAQGPLWSAGGDRGLYKSLDGGDNWKKILDVDEFTGANELVIDPLNPDRMIVSTYQRHRRIWSLLDGGPGSAIYKSDDAGGTWRKITSGLPQKNDMGRIGLAGAPSSPGTVYAIIEGSQDEQGFYRSTDFGETWEKRSSHSVSGAQYYNEITVDPKNPNRIYAIDTVTKVSEDGGKTWSMIGLDERHVDDHAIWIDPDNTDHFYIGGDGGVYETWDRGQVYRQIQNLPLGQFYRVEPDNDEPFYNVYGGTQDNNSLGVPSRTINKQGIVNSDWFTTIGGDGYEPQIDPDDPNIVYTQFQYGGLARYDRRTGERAYIMPHPESGETAYNFNWSTPLLISPHDSKRIYYGTEYLFASDDRGDNWRKISPNLTRQIDRNQLKIAGRVWSVDSVAKNASTSRWGAAIAIAESPVQQGLLFVGTDDGVINISEDNGENWTRVEKFPGLSEPTLVEDIFASWHDADVAYAVFDNHKRGDLKPYVYKTDNRGKSWKLISNDLPERGSAHTITGDNVDPNLLFVGTEFGLFFTQNGGDAWHKMTGNFPTISVRDLEIQERESDLVVGTFGRSIYILDDYSPLRTDANALKSSEATLFPVKDAWLYIEREANTGTQGAEFFVSENPPFGAVLTYYLRDGLKTLKQQRREKERSIELERGDTPYPGWDEIRAEDRQDKPSVIVEIKDQAGNVVRRLDGPEEKGLHRISWNLRFPDPTLVDMGPKDPWYVEPVGPLVIPGTFTATLYKRNGGELTALGTQSFKVKRLEHSPEHSNSPEQVLAFQMETVQLSQSVASAEKILEDFSNRVAYLEVSLTRTTADVEPLQQRIAVIESDLDEVKVKLLGDKSKTSRNEAAAWSVSQRVMRLFWHWKSQFDVPGTYRSSLDIARQEYASVRADLKAIGAALDALESDADAIGVPWTPGRKIR